MILGLLGDPVETGWGAIFNRGAEPPSPDSLPTREAMLSLAADMRMGDMDMSGFRMAADGLHMVMTPATAPWTTREFVLTFVMWAVMMVGMMTPAATPLVFIYSQVGRQATRAGLPVAATAWFVGGYLSGWVAFALVATTLQWLLQRAAWLSADLATTSRLVGGCVLVAAGAYQWTSVKSRCLVQCQSPFAFIMRHGGFRQDATGALALGARHGLYCVGCCWALMALLFVGGVMNVSWVAGLSILVMAERVLPAGLSIARGVGAALCAVGLWWVVVSL